MARCECCEESKADDEVWPCPRCEDLTCEDCFTPQAYGSIDPVTNCITCTGAIERADRAEHAREAKLGALRQARRDERNAKARARYNSPERVAARCAARAELKRKRALEAQKRLANALRIVGQIMR